MPIVVGCQCGQQFRAKDEFAGRQLKCPKCGAMLQVPGGAAPQAGPAAGGGSDLDSLLQMDQSAGMGGMGPQMGAPMGGFPQQGFPQQPMGGGFQQPMGFGQGGYAKPKSSNKSITPLIVGISAVVVIVIAAVIITVKLSGGGEKPPVAQQDDLGSIFDKDGNLTTGDGTPAANANNGGLPTAANASSGGGSNAANNSGNNSGESNSGDNSTSTTKPADDTTGLNITEYPLPESTFKWIERGEHLNGLNFTEEGQLEIYAYSWMTHLLPYVGCEDLYEKFDFKQRFVEGPNTSVIGAEIEQFLNPAQETTRFEGLYFTGMGLSHFVGMSGAEDTRRDLAARLPRTDPMAGIFAYDEIAKLDDIKDGRSQTLMLIGSEKTAGPWVSGGGSTIRGARKGIAYIGGFYGFWSEGTKEPGALASFADGAVRELPEKIDPEVFRAMSTIAGGEKDVNVEELGQTVESMPPGIKEKIIALARKKKADEESKKQGGSSGTNQSAGPQSEGGLPSTGSAGVGGG